MSKHLMKKFFLLTILLALTAFAVNAQDDFNPTLPGEPNALYRITVGISHSAAGTVSGGGSYPDGTKITIRRNDTGFNSSATVYYKFKCWMLNGEEYAEAGTSSSFTYTVNKQNVRFEAVYEVQNPNEVSSKLFLVSDPSDACTFNASNGKRYLEGNSVYLYYNTTSSAFKFQGWYNGNELISNNRYFYYTIGEDDATLTARFTYEPVMPGEPNGNQENVDCVDEEKIANEFRTTHITILSKTISDVAVSDIASIDAALDDYAELSDAVKELLESEKEHLDSLKAKAEELKAAEEAADVVTTDISQMTDVLYSTEMRMKSGSQIVLPIYMKNSAAVTLFQTNVYLPEGFSFAKKTNGKYAVSMIKDRLTDEDDNHVISANLQQDGSLLILCSSQDNYTFDGNDGKVATVTIDVADDVVEGKYLIKMNNQKMVRPNNTGSNVAEYQVVATVKNFTLGDVNDDGDIDGYDLVGISNLILGTNTDGLNRDAADVNQDTEIDGYDYVMEVNTILGTNAATAKNFVKAAAVESELPVLNLSSMVVSAGEQAEMNVGLECNDNVFTLVQTDIEFPAGIEPVLRNGRVVVKLADECRDIDDDHAISCVKQSNGKYRVLVMSQSNTGFNGSNGKLFSINVETASDMYPGMYDVTLSNTKLVRANNTGVNPSDCTAAIICNGTTGISDIDAEQTEKDMYNLNGQRVSKYVQRGIYISNGKKNVKK